MAQKKEKGSFASSLFGSKMQRYEEAEELYISAASNFKLAKRWEDAAKAYDRAFVLANKQDQTEGGDYLIEAANAIKKVNISESVTYIEKAIEVFLSDNQISKAARHKREVAQQFENDKEWTLAYKFYEETAELFEAEGNY